MKRARSKQPFNLILLGDPGSGKATQGARLVKKYPLREFDYGQWLRELKTPAQRRKYGFDTRIKHGQLAITGPSKRIFRQVILETPEEKGVFFNGNPKMRGEAEVMLRTFRKAKRSEPLFLYLSIPQSEMLKRVQSRKGQARSDDDTRGLKNRMSYYKKHIRQSKDFLKAHCRSRQVNGVGTEAEVFRRLTTAIEGLRKKAPRR